jgi:hypothetical protein
MRVGMSRMLRAGAIIFLGVAGSHDSLASQEPVSAPIRDNSFLIEEAYNQERGVVQHISGFSCFGDNRDWFYTFTQEWPLGGQNHQFSYSLAHTDPGDLGGEAGAGDSLLNYRYQVAGGGAERIAFAPRASVLLPTGDEQEGRGRDAFGMLVNLPLSVDYTPALVGHYNLGAGHVFSARDADGDEADLTDFFVGQSLVWLANPRFNVMLEAIWTSAEEVVGPGVTDRSSSLLVNPAVRWAINFPSGLLIVPGIGVPIGLGPSRGEESLFLYLSFEHPFTRERSD